MIISRRRRIRAAFLTLTTVAAISLNAAPAAADPPGVWWCSQRPASCEGKDPYVVGCAADAVVVASRPLPYYNGDIWLMWSRTCGTNWARAVYVPAGIGVRARLTAAGHQTMYSSPGFYYGGGEAWTDMTVTPTTQACASADLDENGQGFTTSVSGWACA